MQDFLGRELKVGDTIAYPMRQGSRMWMQSGTIRSIHPDCVKITRPNGKKTAIRATSRIVLVKGVDNAEV